MGWLVAVAVREVRKDLDLYGFLIRVLRDLNNTIIVVVITYYSLCFGKFFWVSFVFFTCVFVSVWGTRVGKVLGRCAGRARDSDLRGDMWVVCKRST